jgi:hypothetical protein
VTSPNQHMHLTAQRFALGSLRRDAAPAAGDFRRSQWAMPSGTALGGLSQVGSIAHQRQEGGRGHV